MELWNGLRELTAFAERQRLAILPSKVVKNRVIEGSSYLSAERPLKTPQNTSKHLQEPFENLSRRCQIQSFLRLPWASKSVPGSRGPVAGSESLDSWADDKGKKHGT